MTNGAATSVLVGRTGELAELDAALGRVRAGGPSAVLVGGEAGVGKSRLAGEFGVRARAAGAVWVLVGYCLDLSADGLPFAPFTGVLRALARQLGAAGLAGLLPGRGVRDLARLLPELGEPGGGGDPGEARARMFEQMLALLEVLARDGPVVLVIEDVHWADRSTRDLLAFLVGNQHALAGVLIVVTFRSDELHRRHPLRPVLAELGRLGWVSRLELPRLTRREGRALMAAVLGREPAPELAERVFSRSEGNPLFLEALLRCGGGPGAPLPESLRDLVLAEVQRLPGQAQEVLEALAVAGAQCGHGLLAAVTGTGDRELLAALRAAVAGNVLVAEGDGYAFRHALIREAIVGQILPGEKTRWHVRLAQALDADPALVPPGRAVIEQARHWYHAHDTARALASAWQAAGVAGQALAYAEQLAMLARVLELWASLPDAGQRIGASHTHVLEAAAAAAAAAGEGERGIGYATAALTEINPAEQPARAALLLKTRAEMKWYLGRAEGTDDVREALRLVPADAPDTADTAARAQVLSWLAAWPEVLGRPEARAAAEEALQLSRHAGDPGTEAHALLTLATLDFHEHGTLSLDLLEQARTLAGQAHAYDAVLRAAVYESHLLEGAGEHERAAQVARQGIVSAREYGLARVSGTLLAANVAEPLIALGRWDEAADVIEHALELSPPAGTRAALLQLAGELALARGELPAAADSAAACRCALAGFGYRDQNHLPLAQLETGLHLAQHHPGDALTVVRQALDRFDLRHSPRYGWPLLTAGAGACAVTLSHPAAAHDHGLAEQARHLLDRLHGLANKLNTTWPVEQAHRLTFAAEAARAGVTGADPQQAWDAAAQAWDRLGQPYPLACALLHAAGAAMDHGDRDGAAARLARAASLAGSLGAGPLREQTASLARRGRLALPTEATGQQAPGALGLTPRETEVLRLVAAGCSNRDIAAELFISAKTASVHVSNILAKLNATSRTEAAAIAHQAGLAARD